MGCDAHIHIEMKFDGQWHHYCHVSPNRNYLAFTKIAGVRNYGGDIVPLAKPGTKIPDDATLITRKDFEFQAEDAHSVCTLDFAQVEEFGIWYVETFRAAAYPTAWFEYGFLSRTYMFGEGWDRESECVEEYGIEDVRFIIWFDN